EGTEGFRLSAYDQFGSLLESIDINGGDAGTGDAVSKTYSFSATGIDHIEIANLTSSGFGFDNLTYTLLEDFGASSEFGPSFQGAGVLSVTTTSDTADGDTTSIASLLANRGADGQISLREAILAANNTPNISGLPDEIHFQITSPLVSGAHTIVLNSALPNITQAVILDASTDNDFSGTPIVVLDGNDIVASGLTVTATGGGSTIRGLVVTNFGGSGITLLSGANGNTVVGNLIGSLDVAGNSTGAAMENNGFGIRALSNGNTIGGTTAADRNVISGHNNSGIQLGGSGNVVIGNFIGTDALGSTAIGNGEEGIFNSGGTNNRIGGAGPGEGNLISGNGRNAIEITGATTTQTTVQGNLIGVDITGAVNLGNAAGAIWLGFGTTTHLIGGTGAGEGNVIAYSGAAQTPGGVIVESDVTGITILGNTYLSNAGPSIDLDNNGVTANDLNDTDSGGNNLQNFPVLTSASSSGGNTTIAGSLNSAPSTTYRVEYYSAAVSDASGHGEGSTWLGFDTVTSDGAGNASFVSILTGVSVTAGHIVTATATVDLGGGNYGDTSEFAQNVVTQGNTAPTINSDGAGPTASISIPENTTAVTTVTTFDPDGGTPFYSISGADAAFFTIDSGTGALFFQVAPDRETSNDANGDGVYQVTVQVDDGNGGTDTQDLSVTVTDVDEFDVTATLDLDASANAVNENAINGTTVGITAGGAVDADATNNIVTYSLSDDAGGRFTIDGVTGVVTVANGLLLDREAAASHDITVRASSSDGSTTDTAFTISLNDMNEFAVGPVTDSNPSANSLAEDSVIGTPVGLTANAT
ncbi:MAG: cadherin domain-containing protein, partial [Planctomycetaceae bacterium]|nr:cadherin domain-containing protein [Planctomycetaceae bacterium]